MRNGSRRRESSDGEGWRERLCLRRIGYLHSAAATRGCVATDSNRGDASDALAHRHLQDISTMCPTTIGRDERTAGAGLLPPGHRGPARAEGEVNRLLRVSLVAVVLLGGCASAG